jgi:archaellum component FlaC
MRQAIMDHIERIDRELVDVKAQVHTLHRTYQAVDNKVNTLETGMNLLQTEMASMAQQFNQFAKETKSNFDKVNEKFDKIMAAIDDAIPKLLQKIDDAKCRCK